MTALAMLGPALMIVGLIFLAIAASAPIGPKTGRFEALADSVEQRTINKDEADRG